MTTSITRLGPNSVVLSYSPNSTITEFLSALDTAMTAQGWEVHDAAAITTSGTVTARVYRAPIADGTVAYKYLLADPGSSAGYLYLKVFEGWNATTHTGTNQAYVVNAGAAQQVSLSNGGSMYIFATPRYAFFLSKLNTGVFGSTAGSSFSGVVELSRDNADEVPGTYPIFGFVTGYSLAGGYATVSSMQSMMLPRTIQNKTGSLAADYQCVGTVFGRPVLNNAQSAITLGSLISAGAHPLSPNNTPVYNLYSIDMNGANPGVAGAHVRGRLYGIKLMGRNVGAMMDQLSIKVDAQGFFDPSAVDTTPHVLITESTSGLRYALPL